MLECVEGGGELVILVLSLLWEFYSRFVGRFVGCLAKRFILQVVIGKQPVLFRRHQGSPHPSRAGRLRYRGIFLGALQEPYQ